MSESEAGETASVKFGGAAWTESVSVAVWERAPEVPVRVMVGAADGVVIAAVNVVVAEGWAGVSVRVDGLAVTPVGSPPMATETEPLKELSDVRLMVMALLVVPAFSDNEPGETARERSGVGFGGEVPHVVSRKTDATAARRQSALERVRISG